MRIDECTHAINEQVLRTPHKGQPQILNHIGNRKRTEELHSGLLHSLHQKHHQLVHGVIEVVIVRQREEVLRNVLLPFQLMKRKVDRPVLLWIRFGEVGELVLLVLDHLTQDRVVVDSLQHSDSINFKQFQLLRQLGIQFVGLEGIRLRLVEIHPPVVGDTEAELLTSHQVMHELLQHLEQTGVGHVLVHQHQLGSHVLGEGLLDRTVRLPHPTHQVLMDTQRGLTLGHCLYALRQFP